MIKALIIDDEKHIREDLREIITKNYAKEIAILGEGESIVEGLELIELYEPDLLFLDINLKDGLSFDLIKKSRNKNFHVIFITGFDHHAINAIKVGALDYILKPVDEEELVEAIEKAKSNYKNDSEIEKLIEVSNDYLNGVKDKRVILKTADTVYAIYENDILYCMSEGNYTTFFTRQKSKIVISKPIKKVLEILSQDIFIRCHQSYLVNKTYVMKYNKQGFLILNDEQQVPVSSRRKDYTFKMIFE